MERYLDKFARLYSIETDDTTEVTYNHKNGFVEITDRCGDTAEIESMDDVEQLIEALQIILKECKLYPMDLFIQWLDENQYGYDVNKEKKYVTLTHGCNFITFKPGGKFSGYGEMSTFSEAIKKFNELMR